MKEYDVVIVGGATSGSYFAKLLASQGHKVLIIERNSKAKVGSKYDIFHIPKKDFEHFGVPLPKKGDKEWGFEFERNVSLSAENKYPKVTSLEVVGLHMHEYVELLNDWAMSFGAEIEYEATYKNAVYENGMVSGLVYEKNGELIEVKSKLVADCSGIPSVVRRSLSEESIIERFEITPLDMFYVILRYVTYHNEEDYLNGSRGWLYYKTWEAPQPNEKGAILGIGANISFNYAEKIWKEFESKVELPEYTLDYIEKGFTPFRRPPYSFVDDGVVIMGDAACLTKPFNGEGVVSSWVQTVIAADVVNNTLINNLPLTKENLWDINVRYIEEQGAKFAGSLATAIGAVSTLEKENNFFYEKDIIFSESAFHHMNYHNEMAFSNKEMSKIIKTLIKGLFTKRVTIKTLKALLKSLSNGGKIKDHYLQFPKSPTGFKLWCEEADMIWEKIGSIADTIPEDERS